MNCGRKQPRLTYLNIMNLFGIDGHETYNE